MDVEFEEGLDVEFADGFGAEFDAVVDVVCAIACKLAQKKKTIVKNPMRFTMTTSRLCRDLPVPS